MLLRDISALVMPLVVILVLIYGSLKKVSVFEAFVDGAKEGIMLMLQILPFLTAMFVAINVFRISGGLDILNSVFAPLAESINIPKELIPLGLMRPLSGSGALSVTADILKTYGADSYIGRVASVIQGSTETTFYVLAVYFGAAGITKSRHAVFCGLVADCVAFISANFICSLVFVC